jgi:uncharacterized protein
MRFFPSSFPPALPFVMAAVACLPDAARAAPSFDCRRASTTVEHAICRFPQPADLDGTIAALYTQALGLLDAADVPALRTNRSLWLKVRDECSYQVPTNPRATTDVEGVTVLIRESTFPISLA